MKAGWEVKPLGDLLERTETVDPTRAPDSKFLYVDVSSVSNESFSITGTTEMLGAEAPSRARRRIAAGDIIFATIRPTLQRIAQVPSDLHGQVCSTGFIVLRAAPRLDSRYLLYFLFSDAFTRAMETLQTGASYPAVTDGQVRQQPIPLPPLDEQKRIVAVLDEAFEGLSRAHANAEANLADVRELFAAALKAEFARSPDDWREFALSEIGKTVTGSTPRTSDAGNLGGDLPFIKPGDFMPDGRLDYGNEGLTEKGATVSRVLPPGCALMVCIGATIGKAGYSEQKIATNQQINALVPNAGISGEFIYLQFISPDFQREVLRNAGQATLPIINKSKWSALKVRVPRNLTWQHEITDRMRSLRDVISDLEVRYHAAQLDVDTLRQSLLQKAFSGELLAKEEAS